MATMYFCTGTGNPYLQNAVTGDDGVSKGVAIKVQMLLIILLNGE